MGSSFFSSPLRSSSCSCGFASERRHDGRFGTGGNEIRNNGGIVVRGYCDNIMVVDNVVRDSCVGVHVNTTAGMGHVLVKGNTVPNGTEA